MSHAGPSGEVNVRAAVPEDVPLILAFIRELAGYEKLSGEVVATEALLRRHLFSEGAGRGPAARFSIGRSAVRPVPTRVTRGGPAFTNSWKSTRTPGA